VVSFINEKSIYISERHDLESSKRNGVKKKTETNNFEKQTLEKLKFRKTYVAEKGEVRVSVMVIPHF
jgi:hypothetical protein